MNNEIILEMVTILMEMPKEDYLRCKEDLLNDKYYLEGDKTTEWLRQVFGLIEKHRPELQKNALCPSVDSATNT